jgi:hypothetical protein
MSTDRPDPNRELGPFWIHVVNVQVADMEVPGVEGTVPTAQITIEGESLKTGDFTVSIGLSMVAASDLIDLLGSKLREQGIVR